MMKNELAFSLSRRRGLQALLLCSVSPTLFAKPGVPRAVSLFQGATDSLAALGVTPCGIVESWAEKPVYRYLRSQLSGVPQLGLETQPALEKIALLQPDIIFASRFRHQDVAPLMAKIAPVTLLDDVFEFKKTLTVVAQKLALTNTAAQLLQRWDARIAALRSLMQQRFAGQPAPQVSVIEVRPDHIRSYVANSFPGSVMSEVGFAWNAQALQAHSASLRFSSMENIPLLDADLFFILLRANSPAIMRQYHTLTAHPLWQQLRAVKTRQLWEVDSVPWSLSGGILGANQMLSDVEQALNRGRV
ncbi:iron-siderophore ABC transporter substrate-binding protein [Kosakonia quasisacchari]|uniref:Iron-siderophore ABC transporter substrate-binding protein n=1 Tax=Kosakonia quasisacchari TaxID=2529380 RepID=A0A4R0HT15_9ENTR|nr:iron-siderophore ABC transporter substrate-binding protein [Kosakonia quasisacchari]TCC14875.1 iron-siderophore ABC transporter substrate-binding protein [Kosakonia quasisacchari]